MTGVFAATTPGTTPPLDPTAQQAQQWLIGELSKPEYAAARPTLFEQLGKIISDWLNSLKPLFDGASSPVGTVVIVIALVAIVVVAFLVFGLPRLNRRSKVAGSLFGEDDVRDAATLRSSALAAAQAGDYTIAIEEQFRAIARALDERTLVMVYPGTTAHGFAREAARPFPSFARGLEDAADIFDGVRYLGHTGVEPAWRALADLDDALQTSRPTTEPAVAGVGL